MPSEATGVNVERHVSLSHGDIESLDAAFAWVVQQVDREFANSQMVNISIEQVMRSGINEGGWEYVWTAAVSGMTEEPADA